MPSHLTRYVFRRLLANEPIIHSGCLRRQPYSSLYPRPKLPHRMPAYHDALRIQRLQSRTLFNFDMFGRKSRESTEVDMDPGVETMMHLAKMQRMRARLPPPEDVAKAFCQFFVAKEKSRAPVEDNHAQLALQSLRFCLGVHKKREQRRGSTEDLIPHSQVARAANVMSWSAVRLPVTAAHVALAEALYKALVSSADAQTVWSGLYVYVHTLCLTGKPEKALGLVLKYEDRFGVSTAAGEFLGISDGNLALDRTNGVDGQISMSAASTWASILGGFALQNNDAELQRVLSMTKDRGLDESPAVAKAMLDICLTGHDLTEIKLWLSIYLQQASVGMKSSAAYSAQGINKVLKWCLAERQLGFGHEIVREVMATNPSKPIWDAIFVWGAGTGKGVDEINRMIDIMEASNKTIPTPSEWRVPDIATINALVEFAISKNDPYMAERLISLGRDRNIEPDPRTYVLQMSYRLSVGDIDGALIAYKNLQSMDVPSNEDVPTVNALIVALCDSKRHDFDTIMNVAADLSDRRARFEPLTVSKLSILHLNRDEHHDVVDLLNTHAFHYSSIERESIRNAFVAFCLDPSTPIARAWDSYTVLRTTFDETPRPQRTEIMASFFSRERPDMGVHVFQDMRRHNRDEIIPTTETYVDAFVGAARLRDLESLEVIHNQMKLDYNIDVNTYVNNALIIAYTACDRPRGALDFWDEIVVSKEGPSYNSIHVALRACEKAPFGDFKAQEIWSLLRRRHVDLDQAMWASYIAALAGNGDNTLAISTLEEAVAKGECEVDGFLVGSLFAGAAGQVKQAEVEEWARSKYPGIWAELEAVGVNIEENGMRAFRIDRAVAP